MYKLSVASWLPLCVSTHMLVSYNLCSNLGTGYCYENLAGTGGVKGCVCVCGVCGLLKVFCQKAGCCHEWEALLWKCAKLCVCLSFYMSLYFYERITRRAGNAPFTILRCKIQSSRKGSANIYNILEKI